MDTPCTACAAQGTSCCNGYQIFLTPGDVCRISAVSETPVFFTFESPVPEEIEPGYDPQWLPLIMSPNSQVRVLKRTSEKKCLLGSDTGCLLLPDRRPLICRLYPYTFMENGLMGIDPACPISKKKEWRAILNHMGMSQHQARQWLNLLYKEIRGPVTRDLRAAG